MMAEENSYRISAETFSSIQQDNWNKYVLENRELLENLGHLLMGEILTPQKVKLDGEEVLDMVWTKPKNKDPPINEDGYYFTMLHITQLLDKSQATGNLSEEQVMNSIEQVMKALTNVYATKYEAFGLKTISETKTLLISIMSLLKSHLTKSKDMSLIRQLASSYNITEQRISNLPKEETNLSM